MYMVLNAMVTNNTVPPSWKEDEGFVWQTSSRRALLPAGTKFERIDRRKISNGLVFSSFINFSRFGIIY